MSGPSNPADIAVSRALSAGRAQLPALLQDLSIEAAQGAMESYASHRRRNRYVIVVVGCVICVADIITIFGATLPLAIGIVTLVIGVVAGCTAIYAVIHLRDSRPNLPDWSLRENWQLTAELNYLPNTVTRYRRAISEQSCYVPLRARRLKYGYLTAGYVIYFHMAHFTADVVIGIADRHGHAIPLRRLRKYLATR